MAPQHEGAESTAEQDLSPRDQQLKTAEAWISRVEGRAWGDEEALVYLRSRGRDCRDQIDVLRNRWMAFEQLWIEEFNKEHPTHPVSTATLASLPDSFRDFWDSDGLSKRLLDGSMLRAAEWCKIRGFDPWWKRLERRRQAVVTEYGAAQPLWWLFNMARADLAFRLIPGLIERCLIEFTPAAEHEPLPPFTSTIIFSHHRLKLDSSAVIDRMVDVLQRGQDTTGAWRDWAGDPELSIESTAMALHALALARPDRWERSAKKGRDWLWSRQQDDGAWREEAGDSLYLTVLVLDAINLADGERGKLTFKLSSESRTDAVAPSESDAGIEKSPRSVHSLKAAKACQEWMHANVLNQSQFAKRCGRSPKTIRKFFKTGEMRTSDFDDMADRLGVSAPQLLRGELPPPRPTRQ